MPEFDPVALRALHAASKFDRQDADVARSNMAAQAEKLPPRAEKAPGSNDKFKLFLVSYAAQSSPINFSPSVGGGSWVEVGTFDKASLDKVVASIKTHDDDDASGLGSKFVVKAVSVQVA